MGASNGGTHYTCLMDRLVDLQLNEDQIENVLAERAVLLAQTDDEADNSESAGQYLTFSLGAERYAVDVRFVEEIQPLKNLTIIPCTPDFVVGAVNIRGNIMPVMDIKTFFDIPTTIMEDSHKVIVVGVGDLKLGLAADNVEEVAVIGLESIEPQLATLSGVQEEFIEGVAGGQVIVLDIEALVRDRRMVVNENI